MLNPVGYRVVFSFLWGGGGGGGGGGTGNSCCNDKALNIFSVLNFLIRKVALL